MEVISFFRSMISFIFCWFDSINERTRSRNIAFPQSPLSIFEIITFLPALKLLSYQWITVNLNVSLVVHRENVCSF